MKLLKRKTENSLIALILLLTITTTSLLFALPIANAHTPPWTIPTTSYVICVPSTVGVGQYTTIVVWTDRYSPTAGGGIGQRWDGFQINITKPDGTTEIIGPFKAASDVGSDAREFVPDQVGTYKIVFSWPGETVVASPAVPVSAGIGDYYEGSTSEPAYLTVQQEPIVSWQEPPIPTDYWQVPINAANRGWSSIASNWLGGTWLTDNFQAGVGPETAHVLWTQPLTAGRGGGILDAQWPGISMNAEDYESPWGSPIIMNGRIYYNSPAVSDSAKYGYYCMDLYTGQTIWYKNGTDNGLNNPYTTAGSYTLSQSYLGLTQGQIYHYHSVNGEGLLSYLIMKSGSTWYFLDPATGNWILTLINVPSGTAATDQDGSLLVYQYNPTTGNLLCWNSSQAIPPLGPVGTNQQQWKMRFGATIDAVNDTSWTQVGPSSSVSADEIRPRSGYTMNVTIDKNLPISVGFGAAFGPTRILQDDKRVPKGLFGFYKGSGSTIGADPDPDTFSAWVVNINEGATGWTPYPNLTNTQNTNLGFTATLSWRKDITVPLPGKNYTWNLGGVNYDAQVFCLVNKQTSQLWGYSLKDGSLLWGPTPNTFGAMSFYSVSSNMYYDKVLACYTYAGTIAAYNAQTGELLWTYNATAPGYESPYGSNMPVSISAVCDGKIYTTSSEHSPSKPLWRESDIRCINATDGTEIWKLLNYKGFIGSMGLADGYIVHCSDYDNLIYCIGKGPSAVTAAAPQSGVSMRSTCTITGTVKDISPGALATGPRFGYTNGVPAVSDESQEGWMEYIYEQQIKPTNATGVPVSIDAIDPNNNFIHIGDATSDSSGTFGYSWTTPNVPGLYKLIATFKGSRSYGSSAAQTYMTVSEAAATASPYPQQNLPPTEMYFAISTAIIVAAIVIVGAVMTLMLRKRQ